MNTEELECFVSLAGTRNFMRTAESLGLSQPAVSKQIRNLEEELGAKLFDRTTRSVSLTEAGTRFLPDANEILNTFRRSRHVLQGLQNQGAQVLRIGYLDPNSSIAVSQILKAMAAEHENLSPRLVLDQTDANLRRLQYSQLDLLVGMQDAVFSDMDIVFKKIYDDTFHCIIAKDHPLAVKLAADPDFDGTVTTEDLWSCRQILSIPAYLMKTYFSRGHRILPVNENLDNIICGSVNESYALVLAGLGYAMVPGNLLVQNDGLAFWHWKETPRSGFGIYYRRDAAKGTAALVREFIRDAQKIYGSGPSV